jgi:flagella basal body P-ring formation protein FlgA
MRVAECGSVVSLKLYVVTFFLLLAICPLNVQAERGDQQVLTKEELEETLRHYVLEHGPWQPSQIEVTVRSFPPLSLPVGAVGVRILKPTKGVTPGPRRFLLAVEVDGEEAKRAWVQADVRVFGEVVVTSRPLAHYEAITPDAIRLERRDLSVLPTRALTAAEEAVGRQAARALEVNEILTPSSVELPQAVRRGSAVTLVYESSGLRVETSGKAAEGGKVGDTIRVENPSSGKVLQGQILDPHTVRVH